MAAFLIKFTLKIDGLIEGKNLIILHAPYWGALQAACSLAYRGVFFARSIFA